MNETIKQMENNISGLEDRVKEHASLQAKIQKLEESVEILKSSHSSQLEKQEIESKKLLADAAQELEVSKAKCKVLEENLDKTPKPID